jgi:hypothetical protein
MLKAFFSLIFAALCACTPTEPQDKSPYEISGNISARISQFTNLLPKQLKLPSPILDAHFNEEKLGDGVLGPADYLDFYAFNVAPEQVDAWRSSFTPLPNNALPVNYVAPKQARAWWVSAQTFNTLTFYDAKAITGRNNGWVGVSSNGEIYAYSYTM